MSMTHYMELLSTPLNLMLFMAIPVILAEWIAITEFAILFYGKREGFVGVSNRIAGIFAGVYFFGVFLYLLFTAVIPLTSGGGWRGVIDMIAVGFYLAGVVPLGGIALLDLGLIGKHLDERGKLKWHATFVAIFLIVAHIAMIAGMLDPQLSGWKADGASMHKGH